MDFPTHSMPSKKNPFFLSSLQKNVREKHLFDYFQVFHSAGPFFPSIWNYCTKNASTQLWFGGGGGGALKKKVWLLEK